MNVSVLARITSKESMECESLMELRTALHNLQCIVLENAELREAFSFDDDTILDIRNKISDIDEQHTMWWDTIREKYHIETERHHLYLDFGSKIISAVNCG